MNNIDNLFGFLISKGGECNAVKAVLASLSCGHVFSLALMEVASRIVRNWLSENGAVRSLVQNTRVPDKAASKIVKKLTKHAII